MYRAPSRPRSGRCTLVIGALTVVGVASVPSVPFEHRTATGEPAFARIITDLAEILLCTVSLWLAFATSLALVGSLLGSTSLPARVAVRVTPAAWQKVVALMLGGAIVLAPASTGAAVHPGSAGSTDEPRIAGLRLPDRPSGAVPTYPRRPVHSHVDVVVRPGDTLWDIAASQLPPGADDAARSAACRRWYAANRDAIGPDPDLLLPGTGLRAPDGPGERTIR